MPVSWPVAGLLMLPLWQSCETCCVGTDQSASKSNNSNQIPPCQIVDLWGPRKLNCSQLCDHACCMGTRFPADHCSLTSNEQTYYARVTKWELHIRLQSYASRAHNRAGCSCPPVSLYHSIVCPPQHDWVRLPRYALKRMGGLHV